jgi:hypothetical protein
MLSNLINGLNGKKTYICALGWAAYKIGVLHTWWPENATLETALLAGGGLALRDAIAKKQ